jgi:hypothetical protein
LVVVRDSEPDSLRARHDFIFASILREKIENKHLFYLRGMGCGRNQPPPPAAIMFLLEALASSLAE